MLSQDRQETGRHHPDADLVPGKRPIGPVPLSSETIAELRKRFSLSQADAQHLARDSECVRQYGDTPRPGLCEGLADIECGRPLSPIRDLVDKKPHPGGDGPLAKRNRLDAVEDDVKEIQSSMSSLLTQVSEAVVSRIQEHVQTQKDNAWWFASQGRQPNRGGGQQKKKQYLVQPQLE